MLKYSREISVIILVDIAERIHVAKCPEAGQGLKWTKYPAVQNLHRISAERFFQLFLCSLILEM